ncbi:MAG TPA: hypothetical protein VFS43_45255 [Polyangiaceae bacterium]|nr:hypothetical protein [Polyangiaceae bacterium]
MNRRASRVASPRHPRRPRSLWLALAPAALAAGCGSDPAGDPAPTAAPVGPPAVPIADAYLNQKPAEGARGGLIEAPGPDGRPAATTAALTEAALYYDTLGRPLAPGESAPATLQAWKDAFGFPPPAPGESLQTYRDRTGIAIYYNVNELGLGRELGCQRFVDGYDANGQPVYGEACFVTNYGLEWQGGERSLEDAIAGVNKKNTVCITYRPLLKPGGRDGYEVQFYVYNQDDARQEWAELDTLGPRPVPQVCTGCHGGTYDPETHLTRYARFLPAFPDLLAFADGPDAAPGVTRAGQEERLRALNEVATRSPLTPLQREALAGAYPAGLTTPGATFAPGWAPPGWSDTPTHRDLYDRVARPYCLTCHAAEERDLAGQPQRSYTMFESYEAFIQTPLAAYVCGSFSMPNAQPTMQRFWDSPEPVEVRDASGAPIAYPSAADALLASLGLTRADCDGLAAMSDCRDRGDAVCGDAASGMVCGASGRCEKAP